MDERSGTTRSTPTEVTSLPPKTFPGGPSKGPAADQDAAERAENIARLEKDRKQRDALAAVNFTGRAYVKFEDEYARFGYELMMPLLKTGYIFTRCREMGLNLPRRRILAIDREELAQETLERALPWFKAKGLEQGGWNPELGASLKTYFTKALLFQFANIWRKRLRAAQEDFTTLSLEALPYESESFIPGPADTYAQRDEILHGLAGIDISDDALLRTQAALVLTEDGYTQAEIGEILGITHRAVEGLLRRHRSRLAGKAGKRKGR
jgi:DNA-directed RNA polymerase specialized sigma24 family protein